MLDPKDPHALQAAEKVVGWLKRSIVEDATGESVDRIATHPSGTFWLGRLTSEEAVLSGEVDSRGDRLDPCSMGLRFMPVDAAPWTFNVRVRVRPWLKDPERESWVKTSPPDVSIAVVVPSDDTEFSVGEDALRDALRTVTGMNVLTARVDVSSARTEDRVEITVTLVNSSPKESSKLDDTRLYECSLELAEATHEPYQLESLPAS